MAHFWNNQAVVTQNELVPRFYNTYEALKKNIQRYKNKNYGIKRARKGGNGRCLLIFYASLSAEIQTAIGDPSKTEHIMENYFCEDEKAVTFFANWKYPDGRSLLPDTQDKYILNARVANAIKELEEARAEDWIKLGRSLRGMNKTLCSDTILFQKYLNKHLDVQHTLPTNERRFQQFYKKYKAHGHISLIKDRQGKAKRNALKLDDKTQALLESLFSRQGMKPNANYVAGQYEAFVNGEIELCDPKTGELFHYKEFPKLGITTITSKLAEWQSAIGTHAIRNGNRQKLINKFIPHESMARLEFSGSMITIDDRQPPFHYNGRNRVWFYIGFDIASEAIITWVYGKSKEGIILDFYRQMVRNYHEWGLNLPAELECESSLNSSFKNTFLRNGAMFSNVRIEANNARGKRAERFIGDMRNIHEHQREGWIARPHAKAEHLQQSNVKRKELTYDRIVEESLYDIQTWNNTEHRVHKGKSRWEVLHEHQHPDLTPTNYKSFMRHLGKHTASSCNAGIIRLQSSEWLLGDDGEIYTGEALITLMNLVEGKQLDIYWLDDNQGEVFKAYVYINDRCICEALPKPITSRAKIEETPEQKANREIFSRYRATITSYQKMRKNSIEHITVIDTRPKVLNNKFSIPGLKVPQDLDQEVEEIKTDLENPDDIPTPSRDHSWDAPFKM